MGAAAAAALLACGLPALAAEQPSLFRLSPDCIGTYGHDIDALYRVILWLTTGAFILTEGLLLFFVLRFRARPGGVAVYTHGNHRLEVIWTILPGAILFWLALYQFGTWKQVKIDRPDPSNGLVVQVMAKQFEWHFRYAGPDGKFGTEDDVTQVNNLHVPIDTKVTVLLRSQDVIHAFFLPNLRLKQDTVPGLTISQWFEVKNDVDASGKVIRDRTTVGERERRKGLGDPKADKFTYEIACAELCGLGHTTMRGYLHVHTKEDFFAWLDKTYVADVHELGSDPDVPINKRWPADQNKIEDKWMRDNWPKDLKAKWPPK
jgi:cytochrome c oxidase subunit 2